MIKNGFMKVGIETFRQIPYYSKLSTGLKFFNATVDLENKEAIERFKEKEKGETRILYKSPSLVNKDLSNKDYLELAHELDAHYIVATTVEEPKENLEAFNEFMSVWHGPQGTSRENNRHIKVLALPRGPHVGAWRRQFKDMSEDVYVNGVVICGRDVSENTSLTGDEARRKILHSLSYPSHKTKEYYIHLLGTFDSFVEYQNGSYRDVDSLSTLAPVVDGLLGLRYENGERDYEELADSISFDPNGDTVVIEIRGQKKKVSLKQAQQDIYFNIAWLLKGTHAVSQVRS